MTDSLTIRHCATCSCGPTGVSITPAASPSAENISWGTCVGEAKLCDGGTVKDDPRFTCGYQCTGGKHVAVGQYVRCTDASHRPAVVGATHVVVSVGGDTSSAPVYWARCGHPHPFGVACSVSATAR